MFKLREIITLTIKLSNSTQKLKIILFKLEHFLFKSMINISFKFYIKCFKNLFYLFLVIEDQPVTQEVNENGDIENSVNHEPGR